LNVAAMNEPGLRFISAIHGKPGIIGSLLNRSYASLVEAEPVAWAPEKARWEAADRAVFDYPDTIGACTFLSRRGDEVVGFFSFDPRPRPAYGVIGHNCILPEYRRRGYGRQQINEILRRMAGLGIKRAEVSTAGHPFFLPARRMYAACGFTEVRRAPRDGDLGQVLIYYEKSIG